MSSNPSTLERIRRWAELTALAGWLTCVLLLVTFCAMGV